MSKSWFVRWRIFQQVLTALCCICNAENLSYGSLSTPVPKTAKWKECIVQKLRKWKMDSGDHVPGIQVFPSFTKTKQLRKVVSPLRFPRDMRGRWAQVRVREQVHLQCTANNHIQNDTWTAEETHTELPYVPFFRPARGCRSLTLCLR